MKTREDVLARRGVSEIIDCERSAERRCGFCANCERASRRFARRYPITERIEDALRFGPIEYAKLARKVFPQAVMPRAWRYRVGGGPPGCYMVLSRVLNRDGYWIDYRRSGARLVYPKQE